MGKSRKHYAVGMSLLAALVVLAGGVALRLAGATPTPSTLLTAPDGQTIRSLAVDASSGHVYVTLCDSSGCTLHVLDGAGNRHDRTLVPYDGIDLQLAVAPGTGHVFAVQSPFDGQPTRMDMFDARRNIRLATTEIPLSPSLIPGGMATSGNTIVFASPGRQDCTTLSSGRSQCTTAMSGIAVLNAAHGRLRLHRRLHAPLGQALTAGIDSTAGRILTVTMPGSGFGPTSTGSAVVTVFDAVTGRALQRHALGKRGLFPMRMAVDETTGRAFVLAWTSAIAPHQSPMGEVLVLDTHTGALLRTITLAGPPVDVAVDTVTGRVFVADSGPWRHVQWVGTGGGSFTLMPVGAGTLHMLDARTGRPLATVPLGIAPASIAVDEQRGRVFVAHAGSHDSVMPVSGTPIAFRAPVAGAGGLSIIDATTGHLLRTMTLATAPQNLAFDGHTQQLFIGDSGDPFPRQSPDPWAWLPAPLRQHLPFLPHAPATRAIPGKVLVLDTANL